MRRNRPIMAAFVVLPLVFASGPAVSGSPTPWLNIAEGPVSKANCPTGSRRGCGASALQSTPFGACQSFMKAFLAMRGITNPSQR